MKVLACQIFAEGDPAGGFVVLLFIIGVIWFCVQMNKPKGYVVNGTSRTTIKPIK